MTLHKVVHTNININVVPDTIVITHGIALWYEVFEFEDRSSNGGFYPIYHIYKSFSSTGPWIVTKSWSLHMLLFSWSIYRIHFIESLSCPHEGHTLLLPLWPVLELRSPRLAFLLCISALHYEECTHQGIMEQLPPQVKRKGQPENVSVQSFLQIFSN